MAESNHNFVTTAAHALDYPLALAQTLSTQFQTTGIANAINVNTILMFLHQNSCHCCVFEGAMQPRLLDKDHYYVALGSGKLSADPFLRFLVDTFCQSGHPTVREAVRFPTIQRSSSLADWSLADRGMERRFALREPATGC